MKKILLFILSVIIIGNVNAQHGFVIEYAGGGALSTIDLPTGNKSFVGNSMNSFGAGDFGPNEVLYAINSVSNELYTIDTINGSTSLIGSIPPPLNHMWTGMAYDEVDGIMYGISSEGTASGIASLHIIDITNATYSLVGSQGTATAIACLAIDDQGQMYGIDAGGVGSLYEIDKTSGSVSYVGGIGVGVAGMGQGLDFCNETGVMYMTNYNSISWENTLRTVDLNTGATTQVGGLLGMWTGVIAIPGGAALEAGFSADNTEVCVGDQVNFSDQSIGMVTSWLWTFEGGTPSSSTNQNPTVAYNSSGVFDVTLEVSDGTNISTITMEDMITVNDIPGQPNQPSGEDNICSGNDVTYTTESIAMATLYNWEVTPSDAGTITGDDISAVFEPSTTWNGAYTVKVNAENDCGTGLWSQELNCVLNFTPSVFFTTGGGSYCEGGQGIEVTLDGSEVGVDYELYYEGSPTGNIVSGTGSPISFGHQTAEGLYTTYGSTTDCIVMMFGEAYITVSELPEQGSQPTGETMACAGSSEEYQTAPITGADNLNWVLEPVEAGSLNGTGEQVVVDWSDSYAGLATLSVYGSNDCGDGVSSEGLEITVSELPAPSVNGQSTVCIDEENIYFTEEISGSSYNWEVIGGDVVSGLGTSEITVLWKTLGDGSISVIETNASLCNGISDTLEVFVDECTFIEDIRASQINVYPNPARSFVVVDYKFLEESSATVFIYSQLGQIVYEEELVNGIVGSHKVDIQSFERGIYFIKVVATSGESFTRNLEIVMY